MSKSSESKTAAVTVTSPFAEIPVGLTSFGAASFGKNIYLYGGHTGDAHDYYKQGQNTALYRLDISKPQQWELLAESDGLQGLALVEHRGTLYRVGGFAAHNDEGEPHNLHSVADFARFDFQTKTWQAMQPMPVPRSSFDAVVVDDKLFVIGGWNLKGNEEKEWCQNSVWIDLNDPQGQWQVLETPFKRRALSVGFVDHRIYCIGGMQEQGGTTRDVKVYDLATGKWSDGPKLPGQNDMEGFGSSCFNVGGRLVVSTFGGRVLALNRQADGWEELYQLEPGRFFHRLLPLAPNKFLIVGGANMGIGKLTDVPVFEFN